MAPRVVVEAVEIERHVRTEDTGSLEDGADSVARWHPAHWRAWKKRAGATGRWPLRGLQQEIVGAMCSEHRGEEYIAGDLARGY